MAGSRYSVGDLVAEFLSRVGVSACFGIVSVHDIPMLDGIGRRIAIRWMTTRGDHSASDAAETAARALATPGPSLAEVDVAAIGVFPPYAPYSTMGVYARRAAG